MLREDGPVASACVPCYRDDLALVHHLGFGFHADACAPGILALLEPVLEREGLVLELGCGSGLLTRHLVSAGHRVIATDASSSMLDLARQHALGTEDIQQVVLPDDPLPVADAIVSVGHVLNYLPDEATIDRALISAAQALRPGGVLAIDLCDLRWGEVRKNAPPSVWRNEEWVIVTEFSLPSANKFVREMTTFIRNQNGSWRRDDERHENVLIDASRVPVLLAEHGIEAAVASSFGAERLPAGLIAVIGHRRSRP
jgi:SAM-dependent methyltransferase